MMVSENGIYELALKKFGLEKQMIKCIEELSELQKELCKHSLGQGNIEHIIEEIADVEIMLEQMKIGLDIGICDLDDVKSQKLSRLSGRLTLTPNNEQQMVLQNEVKCCSCEYSFMSELALADLGSDPCETCQDLRNWKPKEAVV